MKTNCKNCAAPLPASGICEYCGTGYVLFADYVPPPISRVYVILDAKQIGTITTEMIHIMEKEEMICGN